MVSIEKFVTRMDGNCLFAESGTQTDPMVEAFNKSVTPLGEEIGGGTQVESDGSTRDLSAVSGDSSRRLAVGELPTRSLTGMPVSDLSKADLSKVIVEYKGTEVALSEALKLGIVTVDGNMVKARQNLAAPPKPAPPAQPLYLGDRWNQHRREIGSSADFALTSMMSAALSEKSGGALSHATSRFNETLGLDAASEVDAKAVYNQLSQNVIQGMGEQLRQAVPNEIKADAPAIIEELLTIMRPDLRMGLITRALHGDRTWIDTAVQAIRRELRLRS